MTPVFHNVLYVALITMMLSNLQGSVCFGAPSHVGGHALQKRNAFQLCNVVGIYTNRVCTDYNDYGCFCGIGNMGNNPVDDVDRCCYEHDRCYGRVSCWSSYFTYFTTYTYECVGQSCNCTDWLYYYPCARTTCQCDLEFGECLTRAHFNETYMSYNRTAHCQ